jgi:cob(I)alamin adenosyltransferase
MKKYTNHFDSGYTHLFTGQCVTKDSPLVEAFGAVDELNSLLGMAFSQIRDGEIREVIRNIQKDLLVIGADLASPIKKQKTLDPFRDRQLSRMKEMTESEVKKMEELMKKYEKELPPLRNFILPSGTPGAATLHLARTVTRRVERRIVAAKSERVNIQILKYFNRLSDFLFTLARIVNKREGGKEEIWK